MLKRKRNIALVLVFVAGLIFAPCPVPAIAQSRLSEARVIEVTGGITVALQMNNTTSRPRLIGFDAPEMGQEPWGTKAREHLRKILKDSGWKVFVETGVEPYDKYNRLLVYLWTKDKTFVNEKMLADGYAVLFTFPPNSKYVDLFVKAQRVAREAKLGIWGPDGLKERPVEYKKKHPREHPLCQYK